MMQCSFFLSKGDGSRPRGDMDDCGDSDIVLDTSLKETSSCERTASESQQSLGPIANGCSACDAEEKFSMESVDGLDSSFPFSHPIDSFWLRVDGSLVDELSASESFESEEYATVQEDHSSEMQGHEILLVIKEEAEPYAVGKQERVKRNRKLWTFGLGKRGEASREKEQERGSKSSSQPHRTDHVKEEKSSWNTSTLSAVVVTPEKEIPLIDAGQENCNLDISSVYHKHSKSNHVSEREPERIRKVLTNDNSLYYLSDGSSVTPYLTYIGSFSLSEEESSSDDEKDIVTQVLSELEQEPLLVERERVEKYDVTTPRDDSTYAVDFHPLSEISLSSPQHVEKEDAFDTDRDSAHCFDCSQPNGKQNVPKTSTSRGPVPEETSRSMSKPSSPASNNARAESANTEDNDQSLTGKRTEVFVARTATSGDSSAKQQERKKPLSRKPRKGTKHISRNVDLESQQGSRAKAKPVEVEVPDEESVQSRRGSKQRGSNSRPFFPLLQLKKFRSNARTASVSGGSDRSSTASRRQSASRSSHPTEPTPQGVMQWYILNTEGEQMNPSRTSSSSRYSRGKTHSEPRNTSLFGVSRPVDSIRKGQMETRRLRRLSSLVRKWDAVVRQSSAEPDASENDRVGTNRNASIERRFHDVPMHEIFLDSESDYSLSLTSPSYFGADVNNDPPRDDADNGCKALEDLLLADLFD